MEQARTIGRAARPIEFEILGELTTVDLSLLEVERGTKPTALKRLSERHHSLARHLAGGMKVGEAAVVCGYEISRVSILQDDPAFKELVTFYSTQIEKGVMDLAIDNARVAEALKGQLLREMSDRMEDAPEKIKMPEIIDMFTKIADRTGMGPTSTQQVNVHVGIGDRLEAARKRLAQRTIDITPQEAAE